MKKTKRLCEAQRLPLDRISTLPQPIIETILSLLPTKQAARTSILSREWRYSWTTIPKLEFCLGTLSRKQDVTKDTGIAFKGFYELSQVMLLRQSPIRELKLNMGSDYDLLEFDPIILSLSRNHIIKKLKLLGVDWCDPGYELPVSIFSMRHLTDLDLSFWELDYPTTFNVFCRLQSLDLFYVDISTKTLLYILSNSPSLKRFDLHIRTDSGDKCTINELFACLPVLEHLTTRLNVSEWLVLDPLPQELPTKLIHLKYFCFQEMCISDGSGFVFLLVLIKCSPNLEKIKLEFDRFYTSHEEYPVLWEEYSDVWLEHLYELKIEGFCNSRREMEFVKFILARSPKLKKVTIHSVGRVSMGIWNEEYDMVKNLLEAPRASPVVVVTVR
ncbi:F-box/FBD/LRR-repeat protein At1g13570-like [Bidens hawaiensis]|uniref:F-box/FBD/LRR-repeat protein At1g13570-like n=1 Tax=Bidens hawaiensis TaxID=980011 RepID=UPI004049EC51